MLSFAINSYIHILFIITIIMCLIVERTAIKPEMKWETLKKIQKADGIYGLAAIVVVTTGLLNWFYFGKGGSYYSDNAIFLIKISLFIIVGLLSIYPTVWISRYKKRNRANPPEIINIENADSLKKVITLELILMGIIPLFATLMANGIGF